MMFLIDAKHDLAHSFFALFFAKFQEEPAAGALAAKEEFERMVLGSGCVLRDVASDVSREFRHEG